VNKEGRYQIDISNELLRFRTSSFSPERGSILHSGIYNKELASVLAASAIGGGSFIILIIGKGNKLLLYIVPLIVFIIAFLFFRAIVFKDPYLEIIFDKVSGKVSIILDRPLRTMQGDLSIESIGDILITHRGFEPENPDGIAVVEKIALQHGTVIPGFGERRDFYNIELSIKNKDGEERLTIFSTIERDEAVEILGKIKDFLRGNCVGNIR